MKVSLNWVKKFTDVTLPIEKLEEKIGAQLGAIEETVFWGPRFDGIVVVKVINCTKHPNADKLSICTIDDGGTTPSVKRDANRYIQVVCGAPNVKAGMLTAWIPPGVTVPSTIEKDPFVLEAREIRGTVSNGMLASKSELGIAEDHAGILEIEPGKENIKPGTPFKELYGLDDVVFDIENKMFTHRPDGFGVLGVAREIAGIQHKPFKSPDWYVKEPKFESANGLPLEVKVEDPKLVPRFMAVAMKDVQVEPSRTWLQAALTRVGIRPINNVVDITNFLMQVSGQPLHAYDYDKVKDRSGSMPTIVARTAKKAEKLKLLGGKEVELEDPAIVIATDKEPVGVGGVMGGADTEVDENTKNIIIEVANFDMYNIRRTAMKYGLFTDAVTRFTKGQSPFQTDRVLAEAMRMIEEMANGQQASKVHDVKQRNLDSKLPGRVSVTPEFVNARLGTKLSLKDMATLLENVEFKIMNPPAGKNHLHVQAPFWRTDIEIPEDIVEEIGRLYGYDHLPLELPKRVIEPTKKDPMLQLKSRLRSVLSAAGANEVLTYSFVHGELMQKVGQDPKHAYQLSNALSPDLQYYRPSLIPSLLEKVHPNIKAGYDEFALFEINQTHSKDLVDKDGLPIEEYRLGFVFAAEDKTAKENYSGAPYYEARRYLVELLTSLGITNLVFQPSVEYEPKVEVSKAAIAPFDRKRTSIVKTKNGEFIGELGEFTANTRRNLKLSSFTAGFELDVAQLLKLASDKPAYVPLPRFPKVEQDMSLRVPAKVTYQELSDFITEELMDNKPEDTQLTVSTLDIYQKDKDTKHVTFRISIASYERTLTAEEVNTMLDKVAEAAREKFGAERL